MSSAQQTVLENGGRWFGHYGLMKCPCHDDHRPSLNVSDEESGIRVHCFAGCNWRDVRQALGLDTDNSASVNLRSSSRSGFLRDQAVKSKSVFAQRIWSECRPIAGTVAEIYLRSRGIVNNHSLEYLRFHPNLRYDDAISCPALVAGISTWPSSEIHAIQRTYLTKDGHKIGGDSSRKTLGSVSGGAVRFGPAGNSLVVAEGVETTLSVHLATGQPAWAALSAGNFKNLKLPETPIAQTMIIAADNDANFVGQKSAKEAARRWFGRKIRIMTPTEPGDWNDVLLRGETV